MTPEDEALIDEIAKEWGREFRESLQRDILKCFLETAEGET